MPAAAILTIGNELTSGDVVDTNGPWLAHRLERLGVKVALLATVPDDIDQIARFLRREAAEADFVLVTGGLGGTPDDLTREAVAAAFGVGRQEIPQLAAALRARFARDPDYAARWAELPAGSRPLENPLGGAPGFQLENVYVFPGLPSELRAMFDAIEREFAGAPPIGSWRGKFRLRESDIAALLAETGERWPDVLVGSYPSFHSSGPEVEIVLKSDDAKALADARAWLEPALTHVYHRTTRSDSVR